MRHSGGPIVSPKVLLVHQMCINPRVKVVPNKYIIYSSLIMFAKIYSALLF